MINEKELSISNKSYINKDFASIYSELVEKCQELTSKFDPTTSNESDVFITLMKLMAFIGDKINYNVDKNVLERFMPSATQENTMRDLTSMLGYEMNYYTAGETEVYIKYVGNEEFSSTHSSFTFPRLDTVITNSEGTVQYVLEENCIINEKNKTQSFGTKVIQGVKYRLSVSSNDSESEKITLENLDDNNRIYFPEVKVAQNGVFILGGSNASTEYWTRVTNLNVQELGSYVYKFGYDSSKGLPYVEFPSDIVSLIGDGLTIDYIVTDGADGNVSAKTLNTLKSPTYLYWDNTSQEDANKISFSDSSVLVISNTNASITGADKEDIDTAYNNYKKIIGTFDTLVSCRDYRNAIYNMKSKDEIYNLVSNVVVADRRNDINNHTSILTYSDYGKEYKNVVSDRIDAYDLVVYPLKAYTLSSISSFNQSFLPLEDTTSLKYMEDALEDSQCLSHNYVYPENEDIYAIKNYYKLKAFISTTYKVSTSESVSILSNINKALVKNFNAREVDFGYEIPYDTLLSVIEDADDRIKSVSLYEPELETKFLLKKKDGSGNCLEYSLFSDDAFDMFITIVAKNVLSGRVSLFAYEDTFSTSFGQKSTYGYINNAESPTKLPMTLSNVNKVTTNANITIPETNDGYCLRQNEVIQIITPSLITDVTYPYGINYYLKLNDDTKCIPQNTEYELKSGELCVLEYTDSSDNQVVRIYTYGDTVSILKPNFDMYTTSYRKSAHEGYSKGETPNTKLIKNLAIRQQISSIDDSAVSDTGKIDLFTLTTNDQVEHRTLNQVSMQSSSKCAWIMNNSDNRINWEDDEYLLQDGEYFFQTDSNYSELVSYGSGTLLKKEGFDSYVWTNKVIDVAVLDENGLLGHQDYFKTLTINDSNSLTFLEHEIVTLNEGDYIRSTASSIELTNYYKDTNLNTKSVAYKLSSDTSWTSLTELSYASAVYNYHKAKATLLLSCGPSKAINLLKGQEITLYTTNTSGTQNIKLVGGTNNEFPYLKSTYTHSTIGGENVSVVTVNADTLESLNETFYMYSIDKDTSASNESNEMDVITFNSEHTSKKYIIPNITKTVALMVYVNYNDTDDNGINISVNSNANVYETKDIISKTSAIKTLHKGINCIVLTTSDTSNFTLTLSMNTSIIASESASLTVSLPKQLNSEHLINDDYLGFTSYAKNTNKPLERLHTSLFSKMASIDTDNIFYYTEDLDNSRIISYDDLSSPYAFYDPNNIACKWTISELDFSDNQPDISIARSSMLS